MKKNEKRKNRRDEHRHADRADAESEDRDEGHREVGFQRIHPRTPRSQINREPITEGILAGFPQRVCVVAREGLVLIDVSGNGPEFVNSRKNPDEKKHPEKTEPRRYLFWNSCED